VLAALGWALGLAPPAAVLAGLGLSLSSTAFALQLLAERKQLTSAHGRLAFAVLLFQDLAAIPLLALIPLVGVAGLTADHALDWRRLLAALAGLAALAAFRRWLLGPLFRIVAAAGVQEVFTATALLVVVALALALDAIGLSMALGAFLAGVLLADSEYRHELEADIEPFKGLLLGLFFMGVGMAADFGLLQRQPLLVAGLVLGLVAVKLALLFAVARLAGRPAHTALGLALVLSQGGEFAFVLFGLGAAAGLMEPAVRDLLVLVVTLSMVTTPLLLAAGERLGARRPAAGPARDFDRDLPQDNQVIVAGLGRFGQLVSRVATLRGIGVTALEANPEQVDFLRRFGAKIHYGDASRTELLRAAGAANARVLVLAIDDPETSVRTAEAVQRHFPHLTILARARNRQHAYRLLELGIQDVVRETFHSSLHLAERLLARLGMEHAAARDFVQRFAERDEAILRAQQAHFRDEKELIAFTRQQAQELESLFEADRQER
jgi:Kef-type K+ transport system membrane component KefB/Trk K+ transport system NAD-binding subunit